MILKLIKKLLHHFNYEVVSFAEMVQIRKNRIKLKLIAEGVCQLSYLVDYLDGQFVVRTRMGSTVYITVKRFRVSDYGSMDYARACAEELCEKLNECP